MARSRRSWSRTSPEMRCRCVVPGEARTEDVLLAGRVRARERQEVFAREQVGEQSADERLA